MGIIWRTSTKNKKVWDGLLLLEVGWGESFQGILLNISYYAIG